MTNDQRSVDDAAPHDDGWDGKRAERWVRMSASLEGQLAGVSPLLFAAAELQAGERVLDVGCGTGPTTRMAADLVGPAGSVTGLDVAGAMVDAARAATPADAPIDWVVADATTWAGTGVADDVVLSRFGGMFFDDPPAAFANMARLSAPDGRLAVAVWSERDQSSVFERPMQTAVSALCAAGVTPTVPPADGGPFSLAHREDVEPMLLAAGWRVRRWDTHTVDIPVGGGPGLERAVQMSITVGPAGLLLDGQSESARAAVAAAISADYGQLVGDDGVVHLEGRVHIITATRA